MNDKLTSAVYGLRLGIRNFFCVWWSVGLCCPFQFVLPSLLPFFEFQIFHFLKMLITAYQGQVVLKSNCGNPDVIFRNRTSFFSQTVLNPTIPSGSLRITVQYHIIRSESVNPPEILFRSARFFRAVKQLSNNDSGN